MRCTEGRVSQSRERGSDDSNSDAAKIYYEMLIKSSFARERWRQRQQRSTERQQETSQNDNRSAVESLADEKSSGDSMTEMGKRDR